MDKMILMAHECMHVWLCDCASLHGVCEKIKGKKVQYLYDWNSSMHGLHE